MTYRTQHSNLQIRWLVIFLLLNACVDRVDFKVPAARLQTVVEGMISDEPGPYTVRVSRGMDLDADSAFHAPIENAKIKLYDDEGNTEDFIETTPGVYMTGGVLRGQVGHAYHIVLETPDGNVFESEPDRINSAGEVERIWYEYEARTTALNYGDVPADVFNIYIDANASTESENYVRWRFIGTYKVVTQPELHATWLQGEHTFKDPLPCSGYIVAPALGGGDLQKVAECTCCACWINEYESVPHLSDVQLVTNNQFRNIKLAEVPINNFTFFDKYRVSVEQMSLSRTAYEFFMLVRAQKEGASSLFQPPSGEIEGNIHPRNSSARVVGLFWATSVKRKSVFIPKSDVPYWIPPLNFPNSCTSLPNSSNIKPENWE